MSVAWSTSTASDARRDIPLCRNARTRTTTLTFPPPSILAGTGVDASRERSDGVEADDATRPEAHEVEDEGMSRASRAISSRGSWMSWTLSRSRLRRLRYMSEPGSREVVVEI